MGGRPWPDVPVGVLRTFDSIWFEVEPEKGTWTFSRLDSDVALAQKSGGQIDLILSSTPTWASLQPTQPSYPGEPLGQAAGPANIQDWITYVQTIATRYKLSLIHISQPKPTAQTTEPPGSSGPETAPACSCDHASQNSPAMPVSAENAPFASYL